MQKLVAVVVIVVLFTFTAFIHESEGEGEKTRLIQKNATLQQISGWVESNWNVSDEPNIMANLSIPICLNNTNIINFKLSIDIVDSDSEHAETDQGSDPDTVTIIVSGNNLTETQKGVTPLSYYPGFTSDNESQGLFYLSQEWLIQVNVDCCGGKPKSGSLYFSLYKDHGFAYTINGEYSYMEEEVISTEETIKKQNDNIQFPFVSSIFVLLIIVIMIIIFIAIRQKKR